MAIISLNIPDGQISAVIDAFADSYNYQQTVNGQPNPETKAAFTKRMISEYIIKVVKTRSLGSAVKVARESAISGFVPPSIG